MTHWSTDFTRFRWAPLAVLAYVALWPLVGPAEAVLSLGALIGIVLLGVGRFRQGTQLISREAWALSTALFFCYWLPEFASAFDAVDPGRAWREVLVDLRYLPFLWLVAMAVAQRRARRFVLVGIGVIVLLWTFDALLQAFTGVSLGGRNSSDRLSGVFGADNLKLGLVLASLAPFALDLAARRFDGIGWALCALLIGTVILLAGSRASWLTFALVMLISGWRRFGVWRVGLIMAGGALVAAAVAMNLSTQFESRLERSAMVFSGGEQGINDALAGRLDIWRAATRMIVDHPVNGVGVRGFRDMYPAYARPGDFWLSKGQAGALHAHQLVLEILAETGVIGLLLWLMGAALALRAWRWALPASRTRAFPAALALVVTVFPLNTHLAFYSTFWGGVMLLLVGLYAGCLFAIEGDEGHPDG
jgi:O-antigen ligase